MANFPDKVPQEYINNENPFAYIRNYSGNPFLDPAIRPKLDALQQMQPKFVPLGIDPNTLRTERMVKTGTIIESRIMELAGRAMGIVGSSSTLDWEPVLRQNIDTPGILDILIEINQLKLLYNQMKLRGKVYCTLKGSSLSNTTAIDYSAPVESDYLDDALEYERLDKGMDKED